ncbi:MAG: methionine--tRNA ligase [bacterium]|nr:methionine--tRNA ligase [bacterium]
MSSYYLTTPIYYVNDHPHIGHIYTTLVADTIARYRRLCGDEVYFLTGTDEHGQKIERAAAERGIPPIELADEVVSRYHSLWAELGISHDDFIRTTEERHTRGVEAIVARIAATGDFYVSRHEGWYCAACENYYTEKELLPGHRCPDHEIETELRSEENVFFRLSKYQDRLLEWYDSEPCPVAPPSRANEVRQFVAQGLRDLSVSRATVEWAIPFPAHEGHTIYVWLDALSNYITALGYDGDEVGDLYRSLWQGDGVRLHLVGKDILRFHAVYWPAFLMSAGLPLPTTVWAHGWWLRDAQKISKTVGNIVRPDDLMKSFGTDSLRYFVLREMVFGQDASFSDEAFIDRYNSDLANDLGNTTSRLVTLSRRAFGDCLPPRRGAGGALATAAATAIAEYRRTMDEFAFSRALEALWRLLSQTNQYLVAHEPWKKLKDPAASGEVAEVLWNAMEAVRVVANGLLPFLPEKAPQVLAALGVEPGGELSALEWGGLPTGAELPAVTPIFPRIDKKAYLADAGDAPPVGKPAKKPKRQKKEAAEKPEMIQIDQFFETQLRVAEVKAAEAVPKSKKLIKLTVDVGEDSERTVVAGIAGQYEPEALVGRQVVIVANLQPAKLMGVESNGMVLAAEADGAPILLRPEKPVPNGTRVK